MFVLAGCGGGGGGTPSSPAIVPTPVLGAMQVTPLHVALNSSGQTQAISVSQANYGGVFSASSDASSCNGVASAQQTTSSASFTIVAGSKPGVCRITFAGGGGQSVIVDVTVTITEGGIN
jgi:hypothetical protein